MKQFCSLLSIVLLSVTVKANNIQINSVAVSGNTVTFNISWENSWNTMNNIDPLYPNNWDGAWVFVKYQNNIDNLWKHAKLGNTSSDHTISGGVLQIEAVSDSMGVFIRRTNPGSGNVSATVTLKMGPLVGTGTFNFKVFGTEVVYIPQSDFHWGDGAGGYNTSIQTIDAAKQSGGIASGQLFTSSPAVPATFPMGYNAFYNMKYEITSEQWVDFLNTLNYDQQAVRTGIAPNSPAGTMVYGNTTSLGTDHIVQIQNSGLNNTTPAVYACDYTDDDNFNAPNDGQNIPAVFLSHDDLLAYLDWAGMRPMTELEFEKTCRGTRPRVAAEYAWGSTTIAEYARPSFTNGNGTATESLPASATIVNGRSISGNNVGFSHGPVRSGVFAQSSTGRASSGAGFYGNMEMTGNVWEFAVWIDATGVNFTGNHGDGQLTIPGNANVTGWPSAGSTTGMGFRGGDWLSVTNRFCGLAISGRCGGVSTGGRHINSGGRGCRTAP